MSEFRFHIDPDITRASTPPSDVYNDPRIYEIARQRIFARSWQLIGNVDDARIPGQVHPFTLLEGCLNEPLLLARDRQDQLRCLSNVCTHRGMIVCEHGGVEQHLKCRYHGRRFDLDGTFRSMPEFEQARDFPNPADNLPQVQLRQWGPLLFAALEPAMPFEDWIKPVNDRLRWLAQVPYKFEQALSRDYLVEANWALYCENYLEGFHVPFVHAGLNETLDFGSYRTETFRYASVQIGFLRGGEHGFHIPADAPDHGQPIAAWYFWLFPNLMLNFYPWGISINIVKPLTAGRTRVSFQAYVADPTRLEQGAGAGLDRVEREDEAIVEQVQQGVRSRLYEKGRYSPTREQGTHHFHQLLAEFLRTPQ